jgi:hypothetical protein
VAVVVMMMMKVVVQYCNLSVIDLPADQEPEEQEEAGDGDKVSTF